MCIKAERKFVLKSWLVLETNFQLYILGCRINQYTETNDVSALVLFATPTEPGRCIHIGAQLVIAGANSNKSVTNSVFFKLLRLVPNWILHLLAPLFLFQACTTHDLVDSKSPNVLGQIYHPLENFADIQMNCLHPVGQDLVLLHRQDRYRKKYVKDMPFSQAYNMQHWDRLAIAIVSFKSSSFIQCSTKQFIGFCRLVSLFRDWFQKNAGGAIPWPNGLSESDATVLPHNELFDVWRAHTQMCSICKRALRNIKRTRNTVGMLAVISCLAGGVIILFPSSNINAWWVDYFSQISEKICKRYGDLVCHWFQTTKIGTAHFQIRWTPAAEIRSEHNWDSGRSQLLLYS